MSDILIVANRGDGLGARLLALLNAKVVADALGAQFRFGWPELPPERAFAHAIDPAADTFAPEFLDRYFLTPDQLAGLRLARPPKGMVATKTGFELEPGYDGLLMQHKALSVSLPGVRRGQFREGRDEAFDSLKFSESLEAARAAAAAAPLGSSPVALHLRAGDIVYGMYRLMGKYHGKVCPAPVAIRIISDLTAQGVTPVVFGQDADLCRRLRDDYGVVLASDLSAGQNFSPPQQALFDICLMARCTRIIAGSSAFSKVAGWIGGVTVESPARLFDDETTVGLVEECVFAGDDRVSPLQQAHACWYALDLLADGVATEPRHWRLLDKLIALDPENPFYQFIRVCSLYETGQGDQAEREFAEGLDEDARRQPTLTQVFTRRILAKDVTATPYVERLKAQADAGRPLAALGVALAERLRNPRVAEAYAQLYLETRPAAYARFDALLAPGS